MCILCLFYIYTYKINTCYDLSQILERNHFISNNFLHVVKTLHVVNHGQIIIISSTFALRLQTCLLLLLLFHQKVTPYLFSFSNEISRNTWKVQ